MLVTLSLNIAIRQKTLQLVIKAVRHLKDSSIIFDVSNLHEFVTVTKLGIRNKLAVCRLLPKHEVDIIALFLGLYRFLITDASLWLHLDKLSATVESADNKVVCPFRIGA